MTSFTVPLLEFRQALQSVRVHADPKSDHLAFVRLLPGEHLTVMATDRRSAALAQVRVSGHGDGGVDQVDLGLDDVAKVLAVFRMPADKAEWPNAALRITREGHEATFADAGGLFDGQSLTVPAYDVDSLPDVRPTIARFLAAQQTRPDIVVDAQVVHGIGMRLAAKIATAAKTYAETAWAVLHGTENPYWVVTVGEAFIATQSAERAVLQRGEDPGSDSPIRHRDRWAEALAGTDLRATMRRAGVTRMDYQGADGDSFGVDL